MLKRFCSFLLFCTLSFAACSQTQFSGWLASFNTFSLSKKFSLHFDGQLRSSDDISGVQTILLRPGLNVHVSKKLVLTGGYAYIANRRTVGNLSELLPEHRIWQQALYTHKLNTATISHRVRFEERFISQPAIVNNQLKADGFAQAFRLRYFVRGLVPIGKSSSQLASAPFSKGPFFALQNEVFINTGNKTSVSGKSFDQNRLYAAIGYRLPNKLDLETGYMNQYVVGRTGFTNNHIIQVAVYKRL